MVEVDGNGSPDPAAEELVFLFWKKRSSAEDTFDSPFDFDMAPVELAGDFFVEVDVGVFNLLFEREALKVRCSDGTLSVESL